MFCSRLLIHLKIITLFIGLTVLIKVIFHLEQQISCKIADVAPSSILQVYFQLALYGGPAAIFAGANFTARTSVWGT